jgi:PKD repeat protein
MALTFRSSLIVAAALLVAGCTTKKTEAPDLSGPSELATSLSLTASPDVLSQDGQSTSVVAVSARDANGQPLKGLSLHADILVNNVITDFGQLSAKDAATGNDGRATFTYRAPQSVDNVDHGTLVTIAVTPTVGDAHADHARSVQIRLVPVGVVSGGLTSVPDFTIAPIAPKQLETVTFNASDPTLDSKLISYVWDFGDGGSGGGRVASHSYSQVGSYPVTLTVTDTTGLSGSRSKTVSVGLGDLPKAAFVFSPSAPGPGEAVIFDGSQSSVTPPRQIVSYVWQFGTGRSDTGMIVSKTYDTPGTYNVTLSVTDDAGNVGTATQSVKVAAGSQGGLTASFTMSPNKPVDPATVNFNASASTSAGTIVSYTWDFGLGGPQTTTSSPLITPPFQYHEGTYTITLTVTDSLGLTAMTSQTLVVAPPVGP